jgi:hypothetical protein
MSQDKLIEKGREIRGWRLHRRPNDTLDDLAAAINPIVRGWMTFWGRFYRTQMDPLLKRINTYLVRWLPKKYKGCTATSGPNAAGTASPAVTAACSLTGSGTEAW